jgi:protein TonB
LVKTAVSTLAEKLRSGLLELNTEVGPLYASPTISERVYLLWTFRNFRRLPQQVLNPRQRQLIDKLIQTSTLRRHGPAVNVPIIGTVENVRLVSQRKPVAAASAGKVVEIAKSSAQAAVGRAVGSEGTSVRLPSQARSGSLRAPFDLRTLDVKGLTPPSAEHGPIKKTNRVLVHPGASTRAARWVGPGVLSALGAALLMLHFGNVRPFGNLRPIRLGVDEAFTRLALPATADFVEEQTAPPQRLPKPSAARPIEQLQTPAIPIRTAATISPTSQPPAATPAAVPPLGATGTALQAPSSQVPMQSVAANDTAMQAVTTAITSRQDESTHDSAGIAREVVAEVPAPTPPERVVITAAPRSFSYPVAPSATLTGKVDLKVIIGGDGFVREVRVVSGNRVLADAAVRAVRRWRYRPAELNGHAAEAETNVTISFAGDDAVTIAYRQ